MNKKTTTAGPTGFGWTRSLLAFRHRNPFARFVSTLVAFAIAALLVVGSGAAYADDTAPADTSTTASTDGATTDASTDAPADPPADVASGDSAGDAAPDASADTSSDASSTDAPPADATTDTTSSKTSTISSSPMMTTLKKLADPNAAPVDVTVPCNYAAPDSTTVPTGDFEIDGNLCQTGDPTIGTEDWDTVDFTADDADTVNDGFDDSTSFTNGDSENRDPSTWHINGPTPNGKTDIGTAYAYSQATGGEVYGYFAFTNSSTAGGTQQYDVEYNQDDNPQANANGAVVPTRQEGDLLFRFHSKGSAPLVYDDAKIYRYTSNPLWSAATCFAVISSSPAGGWCDLSTASSGDFVMKASADGLFQEGVARISGFFPEGTCSGNFATTQIRSVTGESFATSALKDYVYPLDVNTPSTCGSLTLVKKDKSTGASGTAQGGGVYQIVGDPRPGGSSDPDFQLCYYDGTAAGLAALQADPTTAALLAADCDEIIADGAKDGTVDVGEVEPGTYTVAEIVPPPGYLLNGGTGDTQSVTIGESESKTVTFENYRQWKGLTVSKTATGKYDATYAWDINKEISPNGTDHWTSGTELDKNVAAGGDTSLYYRVTVTEGAKTTSNYVVSGTITVNNPSDNVGSVTATITESLSGCTIDGHASPYTVSIPNTGDTTLDYTCALGEGPVSAGTNTATVTWNKNAYPQSTDDLNADPDAEFSTDGQAAYTFAESTPVDPSKTVTIEDDHFDFDPPWTITWSAQGTTHTSDVYSYDPAPDPGTCSDLITNTVTVSGSDDNVVTDSEDNPVQDSESGKICVGADLSVSKVSSQSLSRTYLWDITKTNTDNDPLYVDPETGTATTHWDVTVSAAGTPEDSGWQMSGTITVTNPNDWEDVVLTGLTDVYEGTTCTVSGLDTVADRTIPAADQSGPGSKDFDYSCTFGSKPPYDGTNTATATWNAGTASTPSGTDHYDLPIQESEWTLAAEINKQVTVEDGVIGGDPAAQIGGPYTWSSGFSTTIHYTAELGAPPGECETWTNVATLHGDGGTQLGDPVSDDVVVCNAQQLTVEKTAAGHFDRTYHWSLDKFVSADPASDPAGWTDSDTWTGLDHSHLFGYRVQLNQLPWTDSHFTITGSITLTNPNTDENIPAISSTITDAPDVGADATCVVDGGADDGEALVGYVTPEIASGDSLTIDYRCDVADLAPSQYTGGENSVTATNATGSPATAPVTFTKDGEIDKTVTVSDDMTELPGTTTVTYDEAVPDRTYTWDYTVEHTATGLACESFTNHAVVVSNDVSLLAPLAVLTPLDTAEATATVCPQAWTVSKSTDVGDGVVPVGSNIVYTLTAHKTSEANPTNVVLVDDLSAIAPYVDFPAFSAPAGQSVSFSGNVLTWTIDELGATDATLSFTVHVRPTAYAVNLPNLVSSVGSSNCPDKATAAGHDECTTSNSTPPLVLPPEPPKAPQVKPPAALPNTGGPDLWLLTAGLVLLLGGGTLVIGGRPRRRRS